MDFVSSYYSSIDTNNNLIIRACSPICNFALNDKSTTDVNEYLKWLGKTKHNVIHYTKQDYGKYIMYNVYGKVEFGNNILDTKQFVENIVITKYDGYQYIIGVSKYVIS